MRMSEKKIDINAAYAELKELLKQDILDRYNNSEYWDRDIIDNYCYDNNIEGKDKERLEDMLNESKSTVCGEKGLIINLLKNIG